MALIGARERRDMANVETDLQKKLKGKQVISIEVQSPYHVKFFYEDEVPSTQGGKIQAILYHDAYGKRDTILKAFAQIYDRSWSGTEDSSGAFHDFGDGLIYASLRGPGGGKYANISFVPQDEMHLKVTGRPVLRLKNGHEIPLGKDVRKNQENILKARTFLHQKSLEMRELVRQMQGEEGPLIDAVSAVSICPPYEQVANQGNKIDVKGAVGQAAGGFALPNNKKKERISSAKNKSIKMEKMKEELIDGVSLSAEQVAALDKIPSVEMRRMVERNQKAEMLQSISNQMMIFFAGLV